jgi:transcriptional regulator with XRE-family HTH domain
MIERDRWYQELTERLEKDPKYWVESMRFDFVEEIERMMEEQGVTRAELARRLNASPAYVTQLLRALFNPTLLTLTRVADALGARVSLHLHPRDTAVEWSEVPVGRARRAHSAKDISYVSRDRPDVPVVADKPASRPSRKGRGKGEVK